MGRALAVRLLDTGHDVTVWNRTPGRADDVVEKGATEASSIEDAVETGEVVMSMLTDDGAVASVLLPDGAPLGLEADVALVECSTVAPATTRRLAAAYGDALAACPILGAPMALAAGEAALAVAGPTDLLDRLEPVWSSLSTKVRRCGDDPGAALVVKLLNNYLLMAGVAVMSEAAVAGQAAGLPDDLLVDFLGGVVAASLRNRVATTVGTDHDGWFPTPMGAKDVRLLLGVGADHGVGLPLASLVASRYDEAAASGLEDQDITAVVELLRRG
jgi:3-hydroxyisobutyrate dehydrogenase-like beta-hydroxyacid dehydrogenase